MRARPSDIGYGLALALTLVAIVAVGCTRGSALPGDPRWRSDVTETPQPASWPSTASAEAMTAMRALARAYVQAAQVADRATMTRAFLPETRRSAATTIARDLEHARPGGPLSRVSAYRSVTLVRGRAWPPALAPLMSAEDAQRLEQLSEIHEQAAAVLVEVEREPPRIMFAVTDGPRAYLVP